MKEICGARKGHQHCLPDVEVCRNLGAILGDRKLTRSMRSEITRTRSTRFRTASDTGAVEVMMRVVVRNLEPGLGELVLMLRKSIYRSKTKQTRTPTNVKMILESKKW